MEKEFVVPSRNSVDKAGRILRNERVDYKEIVNALNTLSQWRSLHTYPINAIKIHIRRKTTKDYPDAIIAQRFKRFSSIMDKLNRFPSMSLSRMQDIGGLRIVLKTMEDVRNVHSLMIRKSNSAHTVELPPDDYITRPKMDGYRSLHQVFKYKSRSHPELDGLRVEVQLRTRLQHAWATAVETMGVVSNSSFKTGHGSEEGKAYFRLASALFSLAENEPIIESHANDSPRVMVANLKELDNALQFSNKIRALAKSINTIYSSGKKSAYHLLELNTVTNQANLVPFSGRQITYAEQLYKAREQETRDDPNVFVVLIGVGDINAIRVAYPNYFLDANIFLDKLENICKKYQ